MALADNEAYVEDLPEWLIEAVIKNDAARAAQAVAIQLRSIADEALSPLQAAFDIEEISDADRLIWKAWKRYLIALSKTPERPGWPETPDWPVQPQA
jgi:hypothetical protein